MKKIGALLIALTLLMFPNIVVEASSVTSNIAEIQYLDNGDYLETKITIEPSRLRASTRTGSKTTTYKNASGVAMWDVTVRGTFTYDGRSSSCQSVSGSATSYSKNWKVSYSTSKSGNKATCTGTGKHYSGSSLVGSYTKNVTLSCDKNGILS